MGWNLKFSTNGGLVQEAFDLLQGIFSFNNYSFVVITTYVCRFFGVINGRDNDILAE
jgi:hypothetical protein